MQLKVNIERLRESRFFYIDDEYYHKMHIYVVDNAQELKLEPYLGIYLIPNKNSGGSGGFRRGMEEVRKNHEIEHYTHVILMDDDVEFVNESLYRLYAILSHLKPEYTQNMIAGRMFRIDDRKVQYTAAEIWNKGDLRHVGFNLDMTRRDNLEKLNEAAYEVTGEPAEYGGWWMACFPIEFVLKNDPVPLFLHCDDVEYGLRHGGTPIIWNGIQVWHETYEYRQTAEITYYDKRNRRIVNWIRGLNTNLEEEYLSWKSEISKLHVEKDVQGEYISIKAYRDYLLWKRGKKRKERKTKIIKSSKVWNSFFWRIVAIEAWINLDVFRSQKKQIIRGRVIYEKLLSDCNEGDIICVNQHPAIGDAFMMSLYLVQGKDKEKCVLTCISEGTARIYRKSGLKRIKMLTQEETDDLIRFCHFMELEYPDILILHHQALLWSTGIAWELQGINEICFHDLIHSMVFFDRPKAEWKALKGEGNSCLSVLKPQKTILIFPFAKTLYAPSIDFMNGLSMELKNRGYYLYTYCREEEACLCGTERFYCELEELNAVVEYAGGFLGVRSGIIDLICGARCKKLVLYPRSGAENWIKGSIMHYWSVRAFGYSDDVIEVEWDEEQKEFSENNRLLQAMDVLFPRIDYMEVSKV